MSWDQYFQKTKNQAPRALHSKALAMDMNKGLAIDLGCGLGKEALETVKEGWTVLAIDKESMAIEQIEKLIGQLPENKLSIQQKSFEEIKILPDADFIYSYHSLPFCHKDQFYHLIPIIVKAINSSGFFSGSFFGIRDDWVKSGSCTGISVEDLKNYFSDFEILYFNEVEKQSPPVLKKQNKYWHILEIIAKKSV